jgi:hypothetical protein
MAGFMPKWAAYEVRLMAECYVNRGMLPEAGDVEQLTKILDRPHPPLVSKIHSSNGPSPPFLRIFAYGGLTSFASPSAKPMTACSSAGR